MKTLPDFIADGIDILAVGLNPSPNSVLHGYPFATAQNRFWPALNGSRLVSERYSPGVGSMWRLLAEEHIGFTDVVKRPTPGASDLRADDYRKWSPVLTAKIERYRPRIIWFQGKVAYTNYLRYGLARKPAAIEWGEQEGAWTRARVFITPNPSPANAAYSLTDILDWFNRLAEFRRRN